MYVYRFINIHNQIIYVGRTNNIVRRIRNEHFSKSGRGHLPQECYNETARVEYAEVKSHNESKMYELYYIEKYHPKYNQSDIGGGAFSFELNDLIWKPFELNPTKSSKTRQEIMDTLQDFQQQLDSECRVTENVLRSADTFTWLDKLDPNERNEYLRVIYSLERFVQSVSSLSDQLKENVGVPDAKSSPKELIY